MDFLLAANWQAFVAIAVVIGMFALFMSEKLPTEVVAISGAGVLMLFGILTGDMVLEVFSNPAPWTIVAMFIISGALVRTGALESFTSLVSKRVQVRPMLVLAGFALFTLVASAFMNNTPVVVLLIPVAVQIAKEMELAPSKLLMPLSYTSILGGICTLIGTSTNLLVDGVARANGMEPFTLFEVTPLGVILAGVGLLYLTLVAPRILPDRASMAGFLNNRKSMKFFTEIAVPEGSPVVGRNVMDVDLFKKGDMRVIDVLRGDASLRRGFPDVVLAEGDRVVLRTGVNGLLELKQSRAIAMVDRLSSRKTVMVEALISPGCRMIGRSLRSLRLRRRYGVYPLAVHRRNQNVARQGGEDMGRQLDDIVVRIGDTILMEGAPEDIERLADEMELVNLSEQSERAYRRGHAPIALASLAGIVLAAAFGIAPIHVAAMIGVAVVLVTRCIDAEEAFNFVDARLISLIFSMLGIGAVLQSTGAVAMIAEALAPALAVLPGPLMIWAIYLLTSVLTELVSNSAVAVVVTPLAIGLATALGIDPRPFVVAVMIAASASFATPIGYQTNTMVYGPGGYKFADFLKVGGPLNLLLGIISSLLIPFFWPL